MPQKLGDLLKRQFAKLGIETTDDLKALLEVDTEVPDEIAGKIDKGLLTIEAAKTNAEVLKQLRQNILAPADSKMDEIIKELGITVGDDFVNEKNTYEKLALLSKAIYDGAKKKGEANSKQDVGELLKTERAAWALKEGDLQKKLADSLKSLTEKETEFKNTRESDLTSFELQKILLGKDYVFPKEMDSSIVVQTAMNAVNTQLKKYGHKLKLTDAGLVITDDKGEKAYTEKHEPIDSVQNYIDGVLTHNKLLKVNDPTQQQQQQQQGAGGAGIQLPQNGKGNPAIMAEIQQQMAELGMQGTK